MKFILVKLEEGQELNIPQELIVEEMELDQEEYKEIGSPCLYIP